MEVPQRRTQKERREGTIRKLLDAGKETLIEVGYSGASVQRVCERADVSQGALFRHFPTREAFMVAVGNDIGLAALKRYQKRFAAMRSTQGDAEAAIRLLRDACRSKENQALYELMLAARTNEALRKELEPAARAYEQAILGLARVLLPDIAAALGDSFDVLVTTVIATFDGEALQRCVLEQPKLEAARLDLLVAILTSFVRSR